MKIRLALALAATLALVGCGDSGGTVDQGPVARDDGPLPEGTTFPARDLECPAGEAPPCETTEPRLSAAQRTREVGGGDMTVDFVLRALRFPAESEGRVAGFNLDDLDSGEDPATDGTCEETARDLVAIRDPGQIGVDNAFVGLLEILDGVIAAQVNLDDDPDNDCVDESGNLATVGCVEQSVNAQIPSGDLLLLFSISGYNGTDFDDEVSITLAAGTVPEGETLSVDGDGLIEGGQTVIRGDAIGASVSGDVFDGRLRLRTDALPLMFDFGDEPFALNIDSAEMRVDIADGGEGNLGGVFTNMELENLAQSLFPEQAGSILTLLVGLADIDPSDDDDRVCQAVSVGAHFSLVPVTLVDPGT